MQAYTANTVSRLPTAAAAIVMKGAAARPGRNDRTTAKSGGLRMTLAKGEELFAEGDAADHFYKVVSGTVRTCKLLSDGRRQIDEFHLAGDIFGLEPGEVHRFSAEAVGDATVLAFRRRRFETLAHDDPALGGDVSVTAELSLLPRFRTGLGPPDRGLLQRGLPRRRLQHVPGLRSPRQCATCNLQISTRTTSEFLMWLKDLSK